jgi:hypothetical protein
LLSEVSIFKCYHIIISGWTLWFGEGKQITEQQCLVITKKLQWQATISIYLAYNSARQW